jgi:hypothetical protein
MICIFLETETNSELYTKAMEQASLVIIVRENGRASIAKNRFGNIGEIRQTEIGYIISGFILLSNP